MTDFPKILIFPFDGLSNRDIKCKKVDLPDPDGPIMATTFPVSILRFIFFKTLILEPLFSKCFDKLLISKKFLFLL